MQAVLLGQPLGFDSTCENGFVKIFPNRGRQALDVFILFWG
jgi:hypothetical protein